MSFIDSYNNHNEEELRNENNKVYQLTCNNNSISNMKKPRQKQSIKIRGDIQNLCKEERFPESKNLIIFYYNIFMLC